MSRPTLRLFDGFKHTSPSLKPQVTELQQILKAKGYNIVPNGEFGSTTQQAVQIFQRSKSLPGTGIVDAATWNALLGTIPAPTPVNKPTSNTGIIFPTTYAANDPHLTKQLAELNSKYIAFARAASVKYGVPLSTIAGIGSRESHWGLALTPPGPGGTGDGGHGRGLMQVDDRWHIPFIESGRWAIAEDNIHYGTAVVKSCMDFFRKANWPDGEMLLRASVAGFNAGPRRVLESYNAGLGIDYYTAGRDYSQDVMSRVGWFQQLGIRS